MPNFDPTCPDCKERGYECLPCYQLRRFMERATIGILTQDVEASRNPNPEASSAQA